MFGSSKKHQLNKLQVGFSFIYKKQTWVIKEVGEYYWKSGEISTEYTIENNGDEAYLEVEFYNGDYDVYFSESVSIHNTVLKDAIQNKSIIFNGKAFELDEVYKGSYKNKTTRSSRERLTSYVYYYDDEEMITIEQWDDDDLEVFYGREIKPKKIKNIKPN